ncbi:MAG: transcriptional repressor NrdR [Chthonomonadales bacterium]|nr:transcriptional repressor NrdR [Chthonomonadales bacterium]
MKCPFCGSREDKVLDSRETPDGDAIKRRRECKECGRRYTTFEQIEEMTVFVVKRNNRREPFDRKKLLKGMQLACTGRPVSSDALETIASDIERMLYNRLDREVASAEIGDMIMERLRSLDQVAYVRFASVYRQFEDATQFREIVNILRRKTKP